MSTELSKKDLQDQITTLRHNLSDRIPLVRIVGHITFQDEEIKRLTQEKEAGEIRYRGLESRLLKPFEVRAVTAEGKLTLAQAEIKRLVQETRPETAKPEGDGPDLITRLKDEIERLRGALGHIRDHAVDDLPRHISPAGNRLQWIWANASTALFPPEKEPTDVE